MNVINFRKIVKKMMGHRCILLITIAFVFTHPVFSQESNRFIGEVENLGANVNSAYDELNLVFSPDGKTLYFTRSRHPENIAGRDDPGDIWVSEQDENGQWAKAVNAGKVFNNRFYNAVIGFSPDGNTIYLTHHYAKSGAAPKTQGFSFSVRTGEGWSAPQPVTIDNFYNRSDHQSMAISSDGRILVMAINSFGSYGYEDLYVSFLTNSNQWTEPKNMGSTLNSAFQEMTPFIAKDSETLYFASNGHNSMGSRDIFVSKRLDNSWRIWSEPKNLTAINSEGIELSYVIAPDEKFAYFISTQNSDGYGDISRIRLNPDFHPVDTSAVVREFVEPDTVIVISESNNGIDTTRLPFAKQETLNEHVDNTYRLTGTVRNKKNEQPIQAKISLIPVDEKASEAILPQVKDGQFNALLQKELMYKIKVSAEGFMPEEKTLTFADAANGLLSHNFYLAPLEVGSTFQLNNVLFARGTSNLVDSAFAELDKVVEMMQDNPAIRIEISGHTDNQGDPKLNLKLSQQRVERVVNYLTEKGLTRDRIVGKGYGGAKPIASNRSENTRKLNRRVEFTVLKK